EPRQAQEDVAILWVSHMVGDPDRLDTALPRRTRRRRRGRQMNGSLLRWLAPRARRPVAEPRHRAAGSVALAAGVRSRIAADADAQIIPAPGLPAVQATRGAEARELPTQATRAPVLLDLRIAAQNALEP